MSRFRALRGLRTAPPTAQPDPLTHGTVPILFGTDGYLPYCIACDARISPCGWPRATLAAALTDRLIHERNHA